MENKVSITEASSYESGALKEAVVKLLKPLGGIEAFVTKGERVLLKPNMLSVKRPEAAVTTHPALVKVVAELAIAAGGIVMVGDSPGIGGFQRVAEVSGIAAAARESGALLVPFDTAVEMRGNGRFKRINLASAYLEADKIINLPKLKTHEMMTMTCSVKNLFGAVVGTEKAGWHLKAGTSLDQFARLMLEIYLLKKPALNIVDAITAMEGNGPGSGDPVAVNRLIAGVNPVAVDLVAARLAGIPPELLHVEREAVRMGLPGSSMEELEISGVTDETFSVRPFRLPEGLDVQFGLPRFLKKSLRHYLTARPAVNKKLCTLCGVCRDACPPGIISIKKSVLAIETGRCIRCWCCRELCPQNAMDVRKSLVLKALGAFRKQKTQTSSSSDPSGISR